LLYLLVGNVLAKNSGRIGSRRGRATGSIFGRTGLSIVSGFERFVSKMGPRTPFDFVLDLNVWAGSDLAGPQRKERTDLSDRGEVSNRLTGLRHLPEPARGCKLWPSAADWSRQDGMRTKVRSPAAALYLDRKPDVFRHRRQCVI